MTGSSSFFSSSGYWSMFKGAGIGAMTGIPTPIGAKTIGSSSIGIASITYPWKPPFALGAKPAGYYLF